MNATIKEIEQLNSLYKGRRVFYGDLHNHSASGGTSDGKCTLQGWRDAMEELGMDFAAILDHRQVRHMYLPEWEDGVFIGGTEPGTFISDSRATVNEMHYNILFENSAPLEKLLDEFDEYNFEGGAEGHFIYPEFTMDRMRQLIARIKEYGGVFVYPHPKQIMQSEDPCDYWFADETGIEVFYGDMRNQATKDNYKLWCELLQAGKRVWACAGEDGHSNPTVNVLTTLYAEEKKNSSYLSHVKCGDFVCGSVGIKMCMGDCTMGGVCDFEDKKLVISVGDFHKSVATEGHVYKLVVLDDKGIVAEEVLSLDKDNCFSCVTDNCRFYRAEVIDETENLRIAIGNPIWNAK